MPMAKSLVGLFHQPSAVYIDKEFLRTLPAREIRAGLAEVVKVLVCFDKLGFEALESSQDDMLDPSVLLPFIQKSIAIKARVVEQDGERAVSAPRLIMDTLLRILLRCKPTINASCTDKPWR